MSGNQKLEVPFKKYHVQKPPTLKIVASRCKGCDFCVTFCPREILELDTSKYNAKGYHTPQIKDGKTTIDCADCKFCSLICPEFAIFVEDPK